MLQLSNEVLLMILKLLYYVDDYIDEDLNKYRMKKDLLACRAVCRRLANIGQSLAFEHITLTSDKEGYKRLLEMSQFHHLCRAVQCLTGYFEDFEADPTPEQFAESRGIDKNDWTQQEFDNMYEKYCRSYEYQQLLEDDNLDIASLAVALSRFCNLRSVRVLEDLSSLSADWISHDRCFTYSQAGQRLFKAITSALSVSGLGIEELVLGDFRAHSPSLIGIVQGLAPARLRLYQQAFGNLKCLKMLLPIVVYDEDGGRELNCAGISALIQSAPLLQELRLEFDMTNNQLPANFLESLKLPRLRTLGFASALFQDPSCLIKFLTRHAITLKRVDFGNLYLETGSWETVFMGMRDVLTLDSIEMGGVYGIGDFGERIEIMAGWSQLGHKTLNNKAIENFIQRKSGDNPFDLLQSACV